MALTRATERTIALPMYDEAAPDNLKSGLTPTVVVSQDGGAFAAATNAAAEIGTTGVYALTLTAGEMDADLVTVKVTASGACDQVLALVTDPAAPDLSNLDAAVSSRLATADYTEPPSAEATADEVRAELAPELARLDADVSDAVAAPALALTAYDPPTRAEATADKEAVLAAVAALPDGADVESVLEAVAAVKAKTDQIGAAAVTVTSPVASSGSVRLHAGDDYDAAHGRALEFAVADATHALGLDTATVTFKATQATWEATGSTETDGGYLVTFEPTRAQTASLTLLRQSYELEATLVDGDVVTLATGTLAVERDIPAV